MHWRRNNMNSAPLPWAGGSRVEVESAAAVGDGEDVSAGGEGGSDGEKSTPHRRSIAAVTLVTTTTTAAVGGTHRPSFHTT